MKCRYFQIQELVPPDIFRERGERAWELIDSRVVETLDLLRDQFGPCVVNDYATGGVGFRESGFREASTGVGAKYSQHKFGRAMDCKFRDHKAEYVRQYVLTYPQQFPHITCIEANVDWFHFDVRNGDWDGIKVFHP